MKLRKNLISAALILFVILFMTSCAMHPICPAYAEKDSQKTEKTV
jgi:maltodextrin utilization protein YvdJ